MLELQGSVWARKGFDKGHFHIQLEEKAESQLAIRWTNRVVHTQPTLQNIYSEIQNYKHSDEVTEYIWPIAYLLYMYIYSLIVSTPPISLS